MGTIIKPKRVQLRRLVEPYLKAQPKGLGFAIGYASPGFATPDCIVCAGDIQNQFGGKLHLNGKTPFEIASISKTFTATLYALLIRAADPNQKVGDYISPTCLPISPKLADITLDQLVNFTSGLPKDYENDGADATTPYKCPQPYSLAGFLSFLKATPPAVSKRKEYTYSNLAFALMSAILAAGDAKQKPTVDAFVRKMREHIFKPLGLQAMFFDEVSLAELPRGYNYDYKKKPTYEKMAAGHAFFPAYFGEAGIVATPNDMYQWLLFNMGITKNERLTPLLPALQKPSTTIIGEDDQLGLGWFISPAKPGWPASINKDGDLDGFQSFIAFLPSLDPGNTPSQAGAFVLVNGYGIVGKQFPKDLDLAKGLTNEVLKIMLGYTSAQ
jgi:D-alanyl-D-alanine-carboxypeptidase/D-alanyl-D-alanine-endopeptidase